MQFFENEIMQYTKFALSTLDLDIKPRPIQFDEIFKRPVTAHIKISGNWQGMVSIAMEWGLAQKLAEKMLSCEYGKASIDEINESISEITNMIGGNLKSLLPQPSQLSLPIVDTNEVRLGFPGTKQISQVDFECSGNKLVVAIYQITNTEPQSQPVQSITSTVQ